MDRYMRKGFSMTTVLCFLNFEQNVLTFKMEENLKLSSLTTVVTTFSKKPKNLLPV